MNPIIELIKLFNIEKNLVQDNLMNVNITKQVEFNQLPNYEKISDVILKFNTRDSIQIYLQDESEEGITICRNLNNNQEYEDFIKNNQQLEGKIDIKININKDKSNNRISIYNIDSFLDNFCQYSFIDNLSFFSNRFKYGDNIIFVNYDNEYMFSTSSIIMTNSDNEITIVQENRKEKIEKCNGVSNFANNIEYELIPEDFSIISTNINNEFIDRLQKFKIIFSLIYIADYSYIDEEYLKIKLNGLRNRDYIIKLNEFNYKSQYEEFYKIFCWIFQDANEYDKIALTRNVIGMYCKYSHILDIDEKTFLAIKSNYNIYLKENVDKYIELKNKLTEFVINSSNQINDIIGNFVGNFEKNIAAFITFVLGTIIANIVSDSPLDNILTKDVVSIIIAILIGSIVYLGITIIVTYFKFMNYKRNYDDLKESYTEILNQQDIDIIFKNDKEYLYNKKNIMKISIIFSVLWILMIIISFIIIIMNSNSDYIKKIIDILYAIIKMSQI